MSEVVNNDQPERDELISFVYREASLIDDKRLDDWCNLFTEDAYYWIPLTHDQPDGVNHTSLMYEDKLLLRLRIERMRSPRAFSQQPESRCVHVLQCPEVVSTDPVKMEYVMRTRYIYVESRGDEQQIYACTALHDLVLVSGELRIKQKKIHLLNCDAALPSIQLFM